METNMICGFKQERHNRMVPCGRCMSCRINHKRMWTGRILSEMAYSVTESTFLTLTYDEDHVPKNGSLMKSHIKQFVDLTRQSSLGHFRYFLVGEYGGKFGRPHYHMIIFNCPPAQWEDYFKQKWRHGYTKVDEVNSKTAAYVCGYVTKKMTAQDDVRLDGRIPEFARASRQPPLGHQRMKSLETYLHTNIGSKWLSKNEDVPMSIRYMGKIYPVGRYWRDWLRERMGITNPPYTEAEQLIDCEVFEKGQKDGKAQAARLWRKAVRDEKRETASEKANRVYDSKRQETGGRGTLHQDAPSETCQNHISEAKT